MGRREQTMPFLPSFCIALSLSSFDEPPMVAGAHAAACGLLSHGAASALLRNAVAVPRRLAPALVAAKRPREALRLGEHAATGVELCCAAGHSPNEDYRVRGTVLGSGGPQRPGFG